MLNTETIVLTVLSPGVHFQNGDEVRRLYDIGAIKQSFGRKARVGSLPKRAIQEHVFKRLKIRDLAHYRELVGNPRSSGLTLEFKRGSVLTMQRASHPCRSDEFSWYVILDTAIGGSAAFIESLAKQGSLRIARG